MCLDLHPNFVTSLYLFLFIVELYDLFLRPSQSQYQSLEFLFTLCVIHSLGFTAFGASLLNSAIYIVCDLSLRVSQSLSWASPILLSPSLYFYLYCGWFIHGVIIPVSCISIYIVCDLFMVWYISIYIVCDLIMVWLFLRVSLFWSLVSCCSIYIVCDLITVWLFLRVSLL